MDSKYELYNYVINIANSKKEDLCDECRVFIDKLLNMDLDDDRKKTLEGIKSRLSK